MPTECAKCGKRVRWLCWTWDKGDSFPEFFGKNLCNDCYVELERVWRQNKAITELEIPFREADGQGKRMVTVNDSVLSEDGIGKHLKLHTEAAQKYGYSLINITQTPARYVIYMSMVFEKKEMTTARFIICSYCKARYDANQYFKCPNCGGLPTT
jgi:hypothetical protein